jgi:dihydroxyacetone kinase
MLNALSVTLGDEDEPTPERYALGITKAREDVMTFGKARLGDKTLVDALVPFSETLERAVAAGDDFSQAWRKAVDASASAAQATSDMKPKMGRARPLAEKSLGTPDPGAVSLSLIVGAIQPVIDRR